MFLLFLSVAFVAFPDRQDALLANSYKSTILVQSSGSLGIFLDDAKCHPTFPNQTLTSNEEEDWCSNLQRGADDKPWISYSIKNKAMKVKGYAIRNGCCYYDFCCCNPETDERYDMDCCCELYSFSLQGSNDNRTWKTIHKVEKDSSILFCQVKTYEFDMAEPFNLIRFVMDQEKPGCPKCIQLNQVEIYGELVTSAFGFDYEGDDEADESISIIGKIQKQ